MGKVALVTGGSKGIGFAVAERLLRDGYAVATCARNAEELAVAEKELQQYGDVAALQADVGIVDDCTRLVEETVARFGRVDVLVNNAGVYAPVPFLDFTADTWDALFDINVRGPVLISAAAGRHMREQGDGGRIIHISSTNGLAAEPEFAHYNASKAALVSLAKTMAIELAPYGILVNAIAPGWVNTPLSAEYIASLSSDQLRKISPLRRAATPAEIAGAVSYLSGADATYVTGETLCVDGGMMAMLAQPYE
jgi:NAD(P)-dependent dehydrogenase (short-subunit alcohol dehydrogenase family)